MRNRLLPVIVLCASCTWGLGELRGYDACQREQLARAQHQSAQRVIEAVSAAAPDIVTKVTAEAEIIQVHSVDQIERARIAQTDHHRKPKTLPEIRSPEDNRKVQEYAGLSYATQVRRKVVKELPAKIVKGVASVVKQIVPTWLWWVLGVVGFVALGGTGLLVGLWRSARRGLRGMIRIANDSEVKDHFKGATNGAAQREYRRMRAKGLL